MSLLKRSLVCALILLGLGQSISNLLGWTLGQSIFYMTAASPLPYVFNSVDSHEYWSASYKIHVWDYAGEPRTVEVNKTHFSKLSGPHKLKMNTIMSIAFSGLFKQYIWQDSLKLQLCTSNGRLNRIFGIHKSVDYFEIETIGRGDDFYSHVIVKCS